MCNYILLSEKEWHKDLFINLKTKFSLDNWIFINSKVDFKLDDVNKFNPDKIFIPHWSYLIPSSIYLNFECIVFHMTDLPFGRGGSPLQNLIVRGFKETLISAIRIDGGIDTGDIYLKKKLSLDGTAKEIFLASNPVIEMMIDEILLNSIVPVPQFGEVVKFERRKPIESKIDNLSELHQVYDFIRMLDCEGYPHAFIETESFKIEFTNASYFSNNTLTADVRIFKK